MYRSAARRSPSTEAANVRGRQPVGLSEDWGLPSMCPPSSGPEVSTYDCDSSAGTNVSTTSPASAPHPGHLPSLTLIRPTLRPRASAFVTPKSHFASPHRTHRAATTPRTLPPLSDGEARDLLDHVLSDLPDAGRTADAVSRPAHSCRNLPLALRIVGGPWTTFSVRMAGSHKPARAVPANPAPVPLPVGTATSSRTPSLPPTWPVRLGPGAAAMPSPPVPPGTRPRTHPRVLPYSPLGSKGDRAVLVGDSLQVIGHGITRRCPPRVPPARAARRRPPLGLGHPPPTACLRARRGVVTGR